VIVMAGAFVSRRPTVQRCTKTTVGHGPRIIIIPFCSIGKQLFVLCLALAVWQVVRQASLLGYSHHQSFFHDHEIIIKQDEMSIVNILGNGSTSTTISSKARRPGRRSLLRFDWTNLELKSSIAQRMAVHQSTIHCTNNNHHHQALGEFRFRNRFGLGSDLHLWTIALCNAMELQVRLHTVLPWIFWDQDRCGTKATNSRNIATDATPDANSSVSSMSCYFPQAEPQCPSIFADESSHYHHQQHQRPLLSPNTTVYKLYRGQGRISMECPTVIQGMGLLSLSSARNEIYAAGIEFLFSRVSPMVQQEAERQLRRVFSGNVNQMMRSTTKTTTTDPMLNDTKSVASGSRDIVVPPDLITVHIRWGDKGSEMKLVPMEEYIEAVNRIQRERGRPVEKAVIFLATEDPRAVQELRSKAPPGWTIYLDQYFHDYAMHRSAENVYNGNPLMSNALQGKPGLTALGSLLVAMEANDFVLTTQSNWSRLMNEIRTNILDPRCQNCTKMIDLRPAKYGD
jgi:hypothetical protein